MRNALFAAAAVALAAWAMPASAGQQDFIVRNNSNYQVFYIYVSPNTTTEWEEDVLGDDTLGSGDELSITMNNYGDHCFFDIKVEDERGQSREYYDINLCQVTYIDYP